MTRLLAAGLLLALPLTGCGDDAKEVSTGADPSAQETTLQVCSSLLPASVLDTLGWRGGTPSADLGSCVLSGDDGDVSVRRVPVPSEDDDAGAQVVEERCGALSDAEEVDWLEGAEGRQCAVVGPDGLDLGVLVVQVEGRTVVEARVVPRAPTSPERVRAALVEAAQAAAAGL